MKFQATKNPDTKRQRFQLKAYIERQMIPAIVEHEGSDFTNSILCGNNKFMCEFYNMVWDKYLHEKPFNMEDFEVYWAVNDEKQILLVKVPTMFESNFPLTSALALSGEITDMGYDNVKLYEMNKYQPGIGKAAVEILGPKGRAACTESLPEDETDLLLQKTVDMLWKMAFNESGEYALEDMTEPDEEAFF